MWHESDHPRRPSGSANGTGGEFDVKRATGDDHDLTPPASYYDGRMPEPAREQWAEGLDAINERPAANRPLPAGLSGWRQKYDSYQATGDGFTLTINARANTDTPPDDPLITVHTSRGFARPLRLHELRERLHTDRPVLPPPVGRHGDIRLSDTQVMGMRRAVGLRHGFDESDDMEVDGMIAHVRHGRDDDVVELRDSADRYGRPIFLLKRKALEADDPRCWEHVHMDAHARRRLIAALDAYPRHDGPAPGDGGVHIMLDGDGDRHAMLPVIERHLSGGEASDYRDYLDMLPTRRRTILLADGSKMTRRRLEARARDIAVKAARREAYAHGWDMDAAERAAQDWFDGGF